MPTFNTVKIRCSLQPGKGDIHQNPSVAVALAKETKIQNSKLNIIFFDGNCPMCHAWVKRIIKWDKRKVFRFAPLEGETAVKYLSPLMPDYLKEDTIIYYHNGRALLRSDAVIEIVKSLGFCCTYLFNWVPKNLRDAFYNHVAKKRYKYGKRFTNCPLPPPEWRDRFLN